MKSQSLQQHFVPNMATLIAVAMMFLAYHAYTVWAMPNAQLSIPAFIPYQGELTDASGNPIEGNTNLTFRLYNTTSGGTALWTESHTNVPVSSGLFRVNLGSKTAIPISVWSSGALYLGITVGGEAEMTPREPLGSVPFVNFANVAGTVLDGSITAAKLDSTAWTDIPLPSGFYSPPNVEWQKAQYRRSGDIVYLRGTISKSSGSLGDETTLATLPAGFRPPKSVAFVAEPHRDLTKKHRLDIHSDGTILIQNTAGDTPHASLDGIFFSVE